MPDLLSQQKLFPIDECPDLMVDACLWEGMFNLMFISVWGRDTAIQSFVARLTLAGHENGLDQFHLFNECNASIPLFIHSVDRLEKRFARVYRQTLFGSLTNLWLFDRRCCQPDKSSASAVLLLPDGALNTTERLWSTVKETCPLPLLNHWRESVLELLETHAMLQALPRGMGRIQGYQINLNVDELKLLLGEKIRQGVLTTQEESTAAACLNVA